jgi:hypothetical protein
MEESKDLFSVPAREPKAKGMRVVRIDGKFSMDKIYQPGGSNNARATGTDGEKVAGHQRLIRENLYEPGYYIPPTVELIKDASQFPELELNDKQKEEMLKHEALLCTGFHRFEGHYGEKEPTMHVAIVEFFPFGGKPAEYWRDVWRTNENKKEDEIKNERVEIDIVTQLVNMVRKGTVKNLESSIKATIKEMKVTAKDEKSRILNEVLSALGQESRVVNSISESDFLELEKLIPNNEVIKFITRKIATADYDNRLFLKFIKSINDGANPLILAIVNGNTAKNVLNIREKKHDVLLDHFRNMVKAIKEFAKKEDIFDPDYKLPMKYVGQLQNEDDIL